MDTEKIEGSVYRYDKCTDCGRYVRWEPRDYDKSAPNGAYKVFSEKPFICVPCLEDRIRLLIERMATRRISVSASKYTGIQVEITMVDGKPQVNRMDVYDPCVADILQKNYGWMPPKAGTQPTEPLAEQATEP